MNLYIFNEFCGAAAYGVGTYVRELIEAFRYSHINICIIHLMLDKSQIQIEDIDGVRYWHFPTPVPGQGIVYSQKPYFRNITYLLRLHIEDKENLIFHLNYDRYRELAEILKEIFDCKIVYGVHYLNWCFSFMGNMQLFRKLLEQNNVDSVNSPELWTYQNEKKLFECVDHVLCLSDYTCGILQEYYHQPKQKITVVYNGLTDAFRQDHKTALRRKYHIPDIPVILFAGRLEDIKGLTYALRAFKAVLSIHPHCHFIIAGHGAFNLYMKECEDIWMHVTWTGLLEKEKLYDLYSIADIGIMPSFHEQCSYVAIEMMMHSIPLVASTSTGLCEMVEDGVTGLHIPVTEYPDKVEIDTDLLAEKIIYLLQHPEEARRMGENGRKRYLDQYSLPVFRKNMSDFYKSLFSSVHELL